MTQGARRPGLGLRDVTSAVGRFHNPKYNCFISNIWLISLKMLVRGNPTWGRGGDGGLAVDVLEHLDQQREGLRHHCGRRVGKILRGKTTGASLLFFSGWTATKRIDTRRGSAKTRPGIRSKGVKHRENNAPSSFKIYQNKTHGKQNMS